MQKEFIQSTVKQLCIALAGIRSRRVRPSETSKVDICAGCHPFFTEPRRLSIPKGVSNGSKEVRQKKSRPSQDITETLLPFGAGSLVFRGCCGRRPE